MPHKSHYIKSIVDSVIIVLFIHLFSLFIYLYSLDSLSIDFSFYVTTVTGSDMMGLLGLEKQWSTTNGNTITKVKGLLAPSQPSVVM